MAKKPKRNKFNARKVTVDGRTYDSKAEAAYCETLLLREKAGEVSAIEFQRPFALIGPDGMLITTYRADAAFWDNIENRFRVIDVKGFETKEFKIKRKLMKSLLGLDVEIVKA
ncbi:DUF1064 domain-containing protein [Chelativorans xinjiangense]|uniref:DUF1064 domain-containing protein n=1 Tax=Chelativorans xinjiangense TaxID=2681485 RepID=UPI00135948A1|nr:DUF1064 domain-containing protein [Chelativorans xinjiangense]